MVRGTDKPGAASKNGAKKAASTTGRDAPAEKGVSVPLDVQQKCLDIFRDSLSPSSDDTAILQEVKGHLFNRDFAAAFGQEEYLRVYASRWSPSRALAYLKIFADQSEHFAPALHQGVPAETSSQRRVVCLGGGAGGELAGLGAWLSMPSNEDWGSRKQSLLVDLVDIADWHSIVQQLHTGLTSPPELSKYASQAKRDANKAMVRATLLDAQFHQLDVLSSDSVKQNDLTTLIGQADVVTFMFTLNELYGASLPATQALLNKITDNMRSGSHLLVVDSPGSYSTISLNGTEKRYPMQWLLDHTLVGSQRRGIDEETKWEKVVEDESRWFRLHKDLAYPITLEDMRFQMHLFRRLG